MQPSGPMPLYLKIKEHVTGRIREGAWRPGDRIPSESELTRELGVSRMTVNRALRELTMEGALVRVQGSGTFVAEQRPVSDLLELRNIADEIRAGGRRHQARVAALREESADVDAAHALGLAPGARIFRSLIVHLADGKPVQLEDRIVNPAASPDYLSVDFSAATPNEHLSRAAPATEVEHVVEAVMPEAWERDLLGMAEGEPCLQLRRRTWSGDVAVTSARLVHAGGEYRFRARFACGAGALNHGAPRDRKRTAYV